MSKNGDPHGWTGKRDLYTYGDIMMTRTLKFDSKALTLLVSQVYQLFRSLNSYYNALDREQKPDRPAIACYNKLKTCAEIKRLLKGAFDSSEWPESCEKVKDQYPRRNTCFRRKRIPLRCHT